jgi:putative membrane protein
MIYLIIALLLGILAGMITGLIPGIHINLVAVVLLGYASLFLTYFSPLNLVIFIVAMSITHTFLDFLPSIYLGASDTDTELSILPGHEMLIKGKAYEAIILTLYGSVAAIILTLLLTPVFIFVLPKIYLPLNDIMPFILIIVSFFLFYFEKKSRIWALIIFLLAGFLGIASFNLNIKEPLLPLLTGLFGASAIVVSLKNRQKVPKQQVKKFKHIRVKKKSLVRSLFASVIASPLVSFLPGLGSGQAAVIGSEVTGDLDRREFLVLLGAINTVVAGLSFITLYTINKARTGASVAVSQIISSLSLENLLIILGTILISGIFSFFITVYLAKFASKNISKVPYSILSIAVLAILAFVVLFFSGILGFLVFFVSASLGITCIQLGIRRIHLMGCLLIPVILFYFL